MKKIFVLSLFILFIGISFISALEITLNSPTESTEYESNSINLNVNFNELAKCNYTLNAPIPPDSSGASHGIFKLIPSYADNPENYQASPIVGYTDNYNYNLDLKKGYDYTFILRCVNQEDIQVSKEISFSIKDECTENWQCGDWSDCNNFGQSRTCTDTNNCTDRIRKISKPTEGQTCTSETCIENWQCGSWSECINNQKTKTCTDGNSCGTTTNKPSIQQSCTVQDNDDETDEDDEDDEIETDLEIESEEETDGNKTKIKAKLNNGRDVEIKIMPETASQTAIDRLGELEFEIELKEVGVGDEKKLVYEAKAKKQGRFLGLFKIKGEVSAQIDAETGEIISTKKPWWSFLASGI